MNSNQHENQCYGLLSESHSRAIPIGQCFLPDTLQDHLSPFSPNKCNCNLTTHYSRLKSHWHFDRLQSFWQAFPSILISWIKRIKWIIDVMVILSILSNITSWSNTIRKPMNDDKIRIIWMYQLRHIEYRSFLISLLSASHVEISDEHTYFWHQTRILFGIIWTLK